MADWRAPQPSDKPTFPCPGCDKQLRKPYLYTHMREVHGIFGGESGTTRPGLRKPVAAAEYVRPDEITVPIKTNASPRFKVLDSMKVLVDQDGALWIGEKIRD